MTVPDRTYDVVVLGTVAAASPVAGLFVLRGGLIAVWRDYFDLETYRRQTRAE